MVDCRNVFIPIAALQQFPRTVFDAWQRFSCRIFYPQQLAATQPQPLPPFSERAGFSDL